MIQGSGRCHYHPERAGLGVCVECRRVICRECTTQFEGINRCASCLDQRLKALEGPGERREWSAGNVVLALMSLALVWGGILLLAQVAAS
ncbi:MULTISPECIES: hypothetical protein [Myxococcus]|uniref:B box-type domain-containing protein n=1 Tax=Myxococcus xanthus TaxID=34 RepID=A0AAE6KRU2_MYXXA|nr:MULTISPECIES: hypothetical protein [Myxococcus]QDE67627.1 hypothetical protein BHS09_11895 [Myxococcus xanthus]QDE74904.1 hypothetical protein BHS08_11910 [Myxococcus xanthus]QDE82172.1 hypothetical protein BHS07_11800 [Myxococcus xanthus]QDE96475.1 hypothetical protein BHS05_11840 [Myxococcus xanthus]QDF03960.1 hypothetical protein BHS04_12200 [Myxococcus xanthus]